MENREHISILSACAVRYGLGRSTYITSMISEAVISIKDILLDRDINNIIKDIDRAERDCNLGDLCDSDAWFELRRVLKNEMARR